VRREKDINSFPTLKVSGSRAPASTEEKCETYETHAKATALEWFEATVDVVPEVVWRK
jgi:hypothetical protein